MADTARAEPTRCRDDFAANVAGVVLAGGAGRRMGGDKATVRLRGRPLLHYPLDVLLAVTDRVAVVCKRDTVLPHLPAGVEIWCDEETGRRHPLLGVATALRRADGPVLVVAGDMPDVTVEALRALRDAPPAAVAVARAAERLQPLLARYAPEALGALVAAGDRSATAVVEALDPVIVDVAAETVLNVNVPEDLLR